MSAPQIIIICLWLFNLTIHAILHGKPRTGEFSFPVMVMSTVLSAILLYWGGFFDSAIH